MALDLSYEAFQKDTAPSGGGMDLSYDAYRRAQLPPLPKSTAPFSLKAPPVNTAQPFDTAATPYLKAAGSDYASQVKESAQGSFQQSVGGVDKILSPNAGPLGGLEGGLQTEVGIGGIVFSPFAPVTNLVGKAIQFAGDKLANAQYIKDVAATATPNSPAMRTLDAFQNLGGVAMAILGAKGGEIKPGEITPEQIAEVSKHPDVVAAAEKVAEHAKTPDLSYEAFQASKRVSPTHADYAKSQGYEPYTLPDQLPVIEAGPAAKSTEPVIQTEAPVSENLPKGARLVPEPAPTPAASSELPNPVAELRVSTPETPAPTSGNAMTGNAGVVDERPIVNGQRVTKAADDINKGLVKKGFEALPTEAQAKYDPITKESQIQKVSDLMSSDIEKAKAMAKGDIPVQNDIHPQVLFNAVEASAMKSRDYALLRDLANSPHATQLSEAGQTLVAHSFNDNLTSPVKIARDVTKAREGAIEKKSKTTTAKAKKAVVDAERTNLKKELRASVSKRPTWEVFMKELSCN